MTAQILDFCQAHQRKHRNQVLANAYSHIHWGRFKQDYSAVEKAQIRVAKANEHLMALFGSFLEERNE